MVSKSVVGVDLVEPDSSHGGSAKKARSRLTAEPIVEKLATQDGEIAGGAEPFYERLLGKFK